jgi:hypothetical protein
MKIRVRLREDENESEVEWRDERVEFVRAGSNERIDGLFFDCQDPRFMDFIMDD